MCIAFWTLKHPSFSFIFAANRDEYLARATEAAAWRTMRSTKGTEAEVLCGLDVQAGGTWLGFSRSGNFAVLTNFREHEDAIDGLDLHTFRPFSMLYGRLGRQSELCLVTNRPSKPGQGGPFSVPAAEPVGSLSNGHYGSLHDVKRTEWSKVHTGSSAFESVVQSVPDSFSCDDRDGRQHFVQQLFDVISTSSPSFDQANAATLRTTVNVPPIRLLLPSETVLYPDVQPDDKQPGWYGTRSQVVVLVDRQGRAFFISREGHVLDERGEPAWSGKVTGEWAVRLANDM